MILGSGTAPSAFEALPGSAQAVLDAIPSAVYLRSGDGAMVRKRRGFGSRMVEQAPVQDLAGRVFMDFSPEGPVCTIDAPLPENRETAS